MGKKKKRNQFTIFLSFVLGTASMSATGSPLPFVLPDEIESVGGAGTAESHAGVASLSDLSSVQLNPAMLYRNQTYEVSGAYFWPSIGRPFYKAGVIDGVTSRTVAAFEYTGFQLDPEQARKIYQRDTPVNKRASVAVAIPSEFFALGLAAHYVESDNLLNPLGDNQVKGFTLGAGLVAYLTEELRFGLSIQNLNNRDLAAVSPRIFRAGMGWEDKKGVVVLGVDYRDRQRSPILELPDDSGSFLLTEDMSREFAKSERMVLGGIQIKTFDVLKLFASYGKAVDRIPRERAGGGIGLFHKTFSLLYALNKNFSANNELQSTLNLTLSMKI